MVPLLLLRNDRHHVTSLLRTRPLQPPRIRPGIPALGPDHHCQSLSSNQHLTRVFATTHWPYNTRTRLCIYSLSTLGQDKRTHARTQYLDDAKMRDRKAQLCAMTGLFRVRMSSWTDSLLPRDLIGGNAHFSHLPADHHQTTDDQRAGGHGCIEALSKRRVNRTRPRPRPRHRPRPRPRPRPRRFAPARRRPAAPSGGCCGCTAVKGAASGGVWRTCVYRSSACTETLLIRRPEDI